MIVSLVFLLLSSTAILSVVSNPPPPIFPSSPANQSSNSPRERNQAISSLSAHLPSSCPDAIPPVSNSEPLVDQSSNSPRTTTPPPLSPSTQPTNPEPPAPDYRVPQSDSDHLFSAASSPAPRPTNPFPVSTARSLTRPPSSSRPTQPTNPRDPFPPETTPQSLTQNTVPSSSESITLWVTPSTSGTQQAARPSVWSQGESSRSNQEAQLPARPWYRSNPFLAIQGTLPANEFHKMDRLSKCVLNYFFVGGLSYTSSWEERQRLSTSMHIQCFLNQAAFSFFLLAHTVFPRTRPSIAFVMDRFSFLLIVIAGYISSLPMLPPYEAIIMFLLVSLINIFARFIG